MAKEIDITGQRFSYLTVIKKTNEYCSDGRHKLWLCVCDCGKEHKVSSIALRIGHTRSCGCKHGLLTYNTIRARGFQNKKYKHSSGYVVLAKRGHPLADKKGRIFEHRFVMADELMKYADPLKMDVHHIDGNKANNNKDNLVVVTKETHHRLEHGWKQVNDNWYRKCTRCKKELEVNKSNFYFRKNGKVVSVCKNCWRQ